jgi:ketosteroid isomerase-like protein
MAGSDDVGRLKAAYEALNQGDSEAALGVLEPDAEWIEHSTLPEAGTYNGRNAIRAFLVRFLESWHEFRQEIERIVEGGDRVALLLHSFAVGKGSGVEVETRYAHVWTMRRGRGVRVDTYEDWAEALESIENLRASADA